MLRFLQLNVKRLNLRSKIQLAHTCPKSLLHSLILEKIIQIYVKRLFLHWHARTLVNN
jgi:hypothetical protein